MNNMLHIALPIIFHYYNPRYVKIYGIYHQIPLSCYNWERKICCFTEDEKGNNPFV